MPKGSSVVKDGVRVIQGTPQAPLQRPTLFLRVLRIAEPGKKPHTVASLSMARPGPAGYVIKELIGDMDVTPSAALDKAVAIARRGDVEEIYLNADLAKLPRAAAVAMG
ncbi:MAG TPA: hypothetical protein VFV10_08125 [Gammaproteobacteria bacterium]|jgi:hypothetical protein|nr:hypothetical protein [Gammaproteobacteria bacterium]